MASSTGLGSSLCSCPAPRRFLLARGDEEALHCLLRAGQEVSRARRRRGTGMAWGVPDVAESADGRPRRRTHEVAQDSVGDTSESV